MEEVDGYRTLEGCIGMAWGVGGREGRFLLGLPAPGKVLKFHLTNCRELQWRVRVEGARLIRGSGGGWSGREMDPGQAPQTHIV
jgi:hypothetical protein